MIVECKIPGEKGDSELLRTLLAYIVLYGICWPSQRGAVFLRKTRGALQDNQYILAQRGIIHAALRPLRESSNLP